MLQTRVIPCLLLSDDGLVKTTKFKSPVYIGDPINCIKIFNDKEVDELILLDITATPGGKEPNFTLLEEISSECFMPLCYGGGVTNLAQMERLFTLGIEKVAINAANYQSMALINEASRQFGSQSIVAAIDVNKKLLGGYELTSHSNQQSHTVKPVAFLEALIEQGAGEILVNCVHREGTQKGFDLELLSQLSAASRVPLIACGGAGSVQHFAEAISQGGAAAVAVGSMFVFHGKHKGVLINVPTPDELSDVLG